MSDQLIYAMSTKTSFSLERFNDIFRKVYLPGHLQDDELDYDMRRQVIRLLDSLGYCEFDFGRRTVHMCCHPSVWFYCLYKEAIEDSVGSGTC